MRRYWTLGALVEDDGKSVYTYPWKKVMKAADVQAWLLGQRNTYQESKLPFKANVVDDLLADLARRE